MLLSWRLRFTDVISDDWFFPAMPSFTIAWVRKVPLATASPARNRGRAMPSSEPVFSRRELLCRCGMGFGALAFADLMGQAGLLSAAPSQTSLNPLTPKPPPFPAKAKRIIHL